RVGAAVGERDLAGDLDEMGLIAGHDVGGPLAGVAVGLVPGDALADLVASTASGIVVVVLGPPSMVGSVPLSVAAAFEVRGLNASSDFVNGPSCRRHRAPMTNRTTTRAQTPRSRHEERIGRRGAIRVLERGRRRRPPLVLRRPPGHLPPVACSSLTPCGLAPRGRFPAPFRPVSGFAGP